MKNLKLVVILFVFVAFASSQSVLAQNKTGNSEDEISALVKEMETATPEERVKIEEKINAYKKAMMNEGDVQSNEFNDKQLDIEKQEIMQAYAKTVETEQALQLSEERINDARKKLNAAKEDGSLSAQEINEREAKISNAERELKEANIALEKNRSLIMEKHNENSDARKMN